MYGKCDNPYFLKQMAKYLDRNYKEFTPFQISKSLDLFKFLVHFEDEELKNKLSARIE